MNLKYTFFSSYNCIDSPVFFSRWLRLQWRGAAVWRETTRVNNQHRSSSRGAPLPRLTRCGDQTSLAFVPLPPIIAHEKYGGCTFSEARATSSGKSGEREKHPAKGGEICSFCETSGMKSGLLGRWVSSRVEWKKKQNGTKQKTKSYFTFWRIMYIYIFAGV